MFDTDMMIRPHIHEMPPYIPILPFDILSRQYGLPPDEIIKLDANENPYGALPEVSEILANLPYTHIYPDPESRSLRSSLAQYHNLPEENILVGAGADEMIDLLMRLIIDPGDAIINCPPTFGMYSFDADLNRAKVISIPRFPDFTIDINAISETVEIYKPKLIFLATPNNPDGSLLPLDQIETLMDLPLIVVLDEAYIEFAPTGSSQIDKVLSNNNLVVLRTFSKWAGLAGLRLGYGVFPNVMVPHLWKIKQPYTVSVAASAAAQVSLKNASKLEEFGYKIIAERQRLFSLLKEIPWLYPYPSQANFILCRVMERDAAQVKDQLAGRGIFVRYFNKPGLTDHIRISVGKPEHTDSLLTTLNLMERAHEDR
jgi:histidinol-phosphate aminotransferase